MATISIFSIIIIIIVIIITASSVCSVKGDQNFHFFSFYLFDIWQFCYVRLLDVDFPTLSLLIGNAVFAYIHQYIGSVRLLLAISYTIKKDYRTIAKWIY